MRFIRRGKYYEQSACDNYHVAQATVNGIARYTPHYKGVPGPKTYISEGNTPELNAHARSLAEQACRDHDKRGEWQCLSN